MPIPSSPVLADRIRQHHIAILERGEPVRYRLHHVSFGRWQNLRSSTRTRERDSWFPSQPACHPCGGKPDRSPRPCDEHKPPPPHRGGSQSRSLKKSFGSVGAPYSHSKKVHSHLVALSKLLFGPGS